MNTATAMLPPGLAVEFRLAHGLSVVGRVIAHNGMTVVRLANDALHIVANEARSAYFGIYSNVLLANCRQPYDQRGASYLPLPYKALRRQAIDGFGEFLVEATADRRAIDTHVVSDGMTSFFHAVRDASELAALVERVARDTGMLEHAGGIVTVSRALIAAA